MMQSDRQAVMIPMAMYIEERRDAVSARPLYTMPWRPTTCSELCQLHLPLWAPDGGRTTSPAGTRLDLEGGGWSARLARSKRT